MYAIMVFFLPSVFGIELFRHLNSIKKNDIILINYLLLVLFSNYITLVYLAFKNKIELNIVEYINGHYIFSIKYITLMITVNLFTAIVFTIIKQYFVFSLEVKNGRKTK